MTVQEAKAKEVLNNIWDFADAQDEEKGDVVDDAIIEAIGCMQEVEQYRALGTVEELKHLKEMNKNCTIEQLTGFECSYNETGCSDCKGKQALLKAMEKQIAKKPSDIDEDTNTFVCPSCGHTLIALDDMAIHQHCLICGQALKWGEEDD